MSNQHEAYKAVETLAQTAMIGFSRLNALATAIDAAREEPYMVMELAKTAEDLASARRDVIEAIREEALLILCASKGGAQ